MSHLPHRMLDFSMRQPRCEYSRCTEMSHLPNGMLAFDMLQMCKSHAGQLALACPWHAPGRVLASPWPTAGQPKRSKRMFLCHLPHRMLDLSMRTPCCESQKCRQYHKMLAGPPPDDRSTPRPPQGRTKRILQAEPSRKLEGSTNPGGNGDVK